MDLSRSMDVRDGGERGRSRLEQAAVIAGELPALSRGTRFAVVIGKGTGVLAVPLTDDAEAVSAFLEGLSTSLVTGRGTNLESLVTAAARAFQDSFPTRRHIILFSDGEAHQGSFFQGIENALARNISITAVGLGSEAGGVVPSASGRDGGPEADLVSFLRRDALRDAAERTGGIYLDGTNERAAAFLAGHIIAASPESGGAGDPGPADFRRERVSRSYIFILTALAAFGLSWACGKKRKRRET
jgi:Ca-activated chloride channel family protein